MMTKCVEIGHTRWSYILFSVIYLMNIGGATACEVCPQEKRRQPSNRNKIKILSKYVGIISRASGSGVYK